ncbi:hypothetical protein [Enterocloster clostridioformis]|jgi:hypothetical protein|uniref:Uncharacterized protein n=1 Tax=Enterocloster clostridioformis TaxID=1531 RepID=A0A829WFA3_9FIRM|nr:hypothetical protein [Enterocloster clostridioformis]ENZ28695.1 hypothetical protein HMPREF1087_01189 [[Clostridium] clostridioforme 90A1]ENZ72482.1 hypothetical protein HMPREF1081_00899 [[Clostridium] clostridioforme 90A4]GEA37563.1 hypothetical protein Ccl03g_32760 [Enterocloster clostridioformis]
MEYLFVYDQESQGWWLKLDTPEKLLDYMSQTKDSRMTGALDLYLELYKQGHENSDKKSVLEVLDSMTQEERFTLMMKNMKNFNLMYGAIIQAEKINGTIFDGFRSLNIEMGFKELNDIRRNGQTYINQVGGSTFHIQYTQWCRRKELIFPNYTDSDIRIKQFDGGNHYYAYIGDMQLRDGDNLKWNTYEQAYDAAIDIVVRA